MIGEGAAPAVGWGPDHLGPGFQSRTLELLPDEEADGAVATLVRHVPAEDPGALPGTPTTPSFAWLYLHGWNDYFFHTHLAREISRLGGAFYALDLRRYGRSLRDGQMLGWTTSLDDYDEEIGQSLSIIRAERDEGIDVIGYGHSTGGLVASLWADRHPGALRALILASPWLEIQGAAPARLLGQPVLRALARRDPRRPLPTPNFPAEKCFRVTDGWDERDGEPDPAWANDPWVRGWQINDEWVRRPGAPLRPGWLRAILAGQARVAAGLDIRCPVLSMVSARSRLGVTWTPDSRRTDTVIDVDATARRAVALGPLVTVARFDGAVHDLILSAPPVREQVLGAMRRWMTAYVLR
ncbi:alpha/beta hydrolase [Actinomyces timonensis]|uniref:Alpha/beta hydrolase n=1 Tax=Actinomyces timonensis TaxID=1288391 RepID=A0AAU8N7K9_9ACTO